MDYSFFKAFQRVETKIDQILQAVKKILGKEDTLMTQIATDFEALRTAIDDATNKVADRIAVLSGQIKNSMTDAEVAQLKTELQAETDKLNALAADPSNPVP